MDTIYQNLEPEERFKTMAANCYSSEEGEIRKYFSPEELEAMRVEFTTDSMILGDVEEEKKDTVAEINTRIKELKTKTKSTLKKVRKTFEIEKDTLFMFDDQDNNVMNIYDSSGNLVNSRKLFPQEKQTKIYSLNPSKTA